MKILEELKQRILVCDGGMGSLLQAAGLAAGELPETWNILHPEIIGQIHLDYLRAGCDVINTNTFGANRFKYYPGADFDLPEVISAAVRVAREAVQKAGHGYVALDMGPTGKLLKPLGGLGFEDCVSAYAEIVREGVKNGVDLIFIETMGDLHELKAAVLAAKENADLPVFATATFDAKGRLLTGGTPESVVALLEGLRVDALGVNCGLGPVQMKPCVEKLLAHASIPVIVNPNAGLPRQENGKTVYDISPEQFAEAMRELLDLGISVAGGCCGTTPLHIQLLKKEAEGRKAPSITPKEETVVCGFAEALVIGDDPVIIGERINPTGKKRLRQALIDHDLEFVAELAVTQQEAGADALDVNAGLPEIDEAEMLPELIEKLQSVTDLPLQIDTSEPDAMERALRVYNGKPLINSVNGKQEVMDRIFPLAARYGGVVVALTLDENGIPSTADGRFAIARKMLAEAEKYGISRKDILVDCVCMTVSSEQSAAYVALETIRRVRAELGVRTTLGVSNIAFGLPRREIVASTYLTMALQAGLSAAILNPNGQEMMGAYRAFRALAGFDRNCLEYTECYRQSKKPAFEATSQKAGQSGASGGGAADGMAGTAGSRTESVRSGSSDGLSGKPGADNGASSGKMPPAGENGESRGRLLREAIFKGLKEQSSALTKQLLENGEAASAVIGKCLMPALDQVGQDYESGQAFLPQLLMSAEAAKAAFAVIQKSLAQGGTVREKKGRILLATVKGDIHDIGKNIVRVLLENYNYEVIDLGRDVPPETIVEETRKQDIRLVGLSALMTTTVGSMEETIRQLREALPDTKIAVGGAVLTEDYARRIGADAYCADAMATVKYAESVFGK